MYAVEIVLIGKIKRLVDINNLVIFHENNYHVLGFININAFMHQLTQRKPVTAKRTLYTRVPQRVSLFTSFLEVNECPGSDHTLYLISNTFLIAGQLPGVTCNQRVCIICNLRTKNAGKD